MLKVKIAEEIWGYDDERYDPEGDHQTDSRFRTPRQAELQDFINQMKSALGQ